jgi:hypothetical protein
MGRLTELRLTEFKTFRDSVLPLGDIVDALDSRRGDEGPIRGGIAGCPPHGSDRLALGCTYTDADPTGKGYSQLFFDVIIGLRPEPKILVETLRGVTGGQDPARRAEHLLLSCIAGV